MEEMKKRNFLRQVAISFLVIIASIWVIFEEWVWDHIKSLMGRISQLKILSRFKQFLIQLHPLVILLFFAIPVILLFPIKLLALYLITSGKIAKGLVLLITGKLIGTAIAAQLFFITKDRLLTIKIFSKIYFFLSGIKEKLYLRLHQTFIYQKIHSLKELFKLKIKHFFFSLREKFSKKYGIFFSLKAIRKKIKEDK